MGEHQRQDQAGGLARLYNRATIHLVNGFLDADGAPCGVNEGDDFIIEALQGTAPADGEHLWCINGWWGHVPMCDLGFEMNDFGGPSYEAMGEMSKWYVDTVIGQSAIPIFMPRVDERFPHVMSYPLEDVCAYFGLPEPYFGESPNYMIALATMWGASELVFHGFCYPPGYQKIGERASTEFWCGIAHAHGVKLIVPPANPTVWLSLPTSLPVRVTVGN